MKSDEFKDVEFVDPETCSKGFMRGHIEMLHNMIIAHINANGGYEWVVEPPVTSEFTGSLTFYKRPRNDGLVDLIARLEHKHDD